MDSQRGSLFAQKINILKQGCCVLASFLAFSLSPHSLNNKKVKCKEKEIVNLDLIINIYFGYIWCVGKSWKNNLGGREN